MTSIDYTPQWFWARVAVGAPDECWKWLRSCTADGYGQLNWMRKASYAHRIAMSLTDGDWDSKLHVLHRCDNPACCNPAHLWRGTHAQNVRDMMVKGRGLKARGEANGQSSLTADDIRAIRAGTQTAASAAAEFGVHVVTIRTIRKRKTWRHVDD